MAVLVIENELTIVEVAAVVAVVVFIALVLSVIAILLIFVLVIVVLVATAINVAGFDVAGKYSCNTKHIHGLYYQNY